MKPLKREEKKPLKREEKDCSVNQMLVSKLKSNRKFQGSRALPNITLRSICII
jgi:hypothetical protein